MTRKIPSPVIAVVSDALANGYTHAQIDYFMEAAGLELNPSPGGNKQVKTRGWLTYANNTATDPLGILGKVIAEFMEVAPDSNQERVTEMLQKYGLSYMKGGYITSLGATAVSKTLQDIPASAVTASCALSASKCS